MVFKFWHLVTISTRDVTLPDGLKTLILFLHQGLDCVTFPETLQTVNLRASFNQSLQGVTLPGGLQTLTCSCKFVNESLQGMTL